MERRADLAGADPYPGEEPQTADNLKRDYTDLMHLPSQGDEYAWVTDGKHVLVGPNTSTPIIKLWKQMTGLDDFQGPSAHGVLDVEARWNAEWSVGQSSISLHLLQKLLKTYSKAMGWRFRALTDQGGMPFEVLKVSAFDPPWGYEDVRPRHGEVPPRVYHVAPAHARDDILTNGLDATGRSHNLGFGWDQWNPETGVHGNPDDPDADYEYRPEGIYAFNDYPSATGYGGPGHDVWEINTQHPSMRGIDTIRDPSIAHNWGADEYRGHVFERVPPEALRRVEPGEHLARVAAIQVMPPPDDMVLDSFGHPFPLNPDQQGMNAYDDDGTWLGSLVYRPPTADYLWIDNVATIPGAGIAPIIAFKNWIEQTYPGMRLECYALNGAIGALVDRYNASLGQTALGPELDEWQDMDAMATPDMRDYFQQHLDERRRHAMADRTGNPEIDNLIEMFLQQPQGDWTPDDNPIEHLRYPEVSHGMCDVVSEQFAEFAKQHGFKAYVTNTDTEEMGYQPTGPGGEIGFNDNDEMQYGHYPEHTIVTIVVNDPDYHFGREYYIDFTATQYGYTDHPKVTSSVPGIGEINPGLKDWKNTEWGDSGQWDQLTQVPFYGEQDYPDDEPAPGPRVCSECHEPFPTYDSWRLHVERAHINPDRKPLDSPYPVVDLDKPIPAGWNTNIMDKTVQRQAASQVMIPGPIPFIFDIEKDRVFVGHPGERHSDIQGRFTPGGIVEGIYRPDGRVELRTDTDMPYTISHLMELWKYMHPELMPKGIDYIEGDKKYKLASSNVGHKVRNLAFTDPAVYQVYGMLAPYGTVYAVGGIVRDVVLGKLPKDVDLLVQGIEPDALEMLLSYLPGKVDFQGKNYGVFRYKSPDRHEVEITTPRTDRSTGEGRRDFEVFTDPHMPIEQDLARRDFTANSMAVNLATGELTDPYQGVIDTRERTLRAVNDDAFPEDPSRLLRALAATSQHGLEPDADLRKAMAEHAHRVKKVKGNAMCNHLDKVFAGDDPARAIQLAMDTGILHHLMPEVAASQGFDQKSKYHRLPLDQHLLEVLRGVQEQSPDKDLRLAALLHDIGKPASQWLDDEGYGHYYHQDDENKPHYGEGASHQHVGAEMSQALMERLHYPLKRIQRVSHLVQHHMFPSFNGANGAKKFLKRVGSEHAFDLLKLRRADGEGKGSTDFENKVPVDLQEQLVQNVLHHREPFSLKDLAINGHDLMDIGYPQGPGIGDTLNHLNDQVLENPTLNDRDTLLGLAQQWMAYNPAQPTSMPQPDPTQGQEKQAAGETMRMFVSFDVPAELEAPIRQWQQQVMALYPDLRPDQQGLHVTLAFVGDINMQQAQAIQQAIIELHQTMPLPVFSVAGYEEKDTLSWFRLQDDGSGEAWFNALWQRLAPITGYHPQFLPWEAHLTMFRYQTRPGVTIPPPQLGTFQATEVLLYQSSRDTGYTRFSNILDPVHDKLDPDVFDHPGNTAPVLKPRLIRWVKNLVYKTMRDGGWPDPSKYLTMVLTGSLTTYQWAAHSDFDVSLWVDANYFPDWVRGDLISLIIESCDGTIVPGTTHPIQCFVVAPGVEKRDLYKPGLRSGYSLDEQRWIVYPEKTRSVDVQKEFPALINYCQMVEDKMRLLLRFDAVGAKTYWRRIHHQRMVDQRAGKGDYAESNVIYKWLANAGLFPSISDVTGEYIASVLDWRDDEADREAPSHTEEAVRAQAHARRRQGVAPDEGSSGQVEFSWPSGDDILALAPIAVDNYQGVRDPGLLHAAVGAAQSQHYYGGVTDPFLLAAHLINNIQRQQALVEGNKRTAVLSGLSFLIENGFPEAESLLADIPLPMPELEAQALPLSEQVVRMAEGHETPEQLAHSLRQGVMAVRQQEAQGDQWQ